MNSTRVASKPKPATQRAPAPAASPAKAAAPAPVKTPTKPATKKTAAAPRSKPPTNAKATPPTAPEATPEARKAARRQRLVRDSFTMPESDIELIGRLKSVALGAQRAAKKSELLRAGLHALAGLDARALVAALDALEAVKTGRPKKA